MSAGPLVSVVIPARDEASVIGRCLAHVLAQDWPDERLEVLVVDGGSTDGTGEVALAALEGHGLARAEVVPNPAGTTPSNLNAGLAVAEGDYVVRVDARSFVPPDYVRRCVELLATRDDVVVTGGAQVAVSRGSDATSIGIARALNNRYAMGGSAYRSGRDGPADTVYLGAFRTEDLRRVGGWSTEWLTNQDYELNRRIARDGRLVWVQSSLEVGYLPRPSLRALWQQYRRFGRWKAAYFFQVEAPRPRQLVLLLGPPVAAVAAVLAALVLGRRTWRLGAVLGVAGAAAVEARGPTGPPGPPASHLVSLVASAVVAGAWWFGVAEGVVRAGRLEA